MRRLPPPGRTAPAKRCGGSAWPASGGSDPSRWTIRSGYLRPAPGRHRRRASWKSRFSRSIRRARCPSAAAVGASTRREMVSVRQEPTTSRQVQGEHVVQAEPASDALIGERRVDVAVEDGRPPSSRPITSVTRCAREAAKSRLRPRFSSPAEDEVGILARRAEPLRFARLDHARRPSSRSNWATSRSCVVLPEPSRLSKVTNTRHVGVNEQLIAARTRARPAARSGQSRRSRTTRITARLPRCTATSRTSRRACPARLHPVGAGVREEHLVAVHLTSCRRSARPSAGRNAESRRDLAERGIAERGPGEQRLVVGGRDVADVVEPGALA